jgi:preprotein translocase subunit SecD
VDRTRRWALLVVALSLFGSGCQTSTHRAGPTPNLVTTQLTVFGGASASPAELRASAVILQRRIASITGGKVVVTVRGQHLEVQAAAAAKPALTALVRPGRLEFRRVIEAEPLTPPTAAPCCVPWRSGAVYTPTMYAALDCAAGRPITGGAPEAPNREIVACDQARAEKFHLAVANVVGADVKGASVHSDQLGTQVQVEVNFTGKGQDHFTSLTREAFGATPPTNRVAIVLDGVVYSAPTILAVINDDAQISGPFTQDEAELLADVLRYGALPVAFAVTS